jgi:hypothetical protein
MNTIYNWMDKEDQNEDIADMIKEAYIHIVSCHEEKLFKPQCTGSIFALKCINKLGFKFNDGAANSENNNKPLNYTFTVVDKKPEPKDEQI